MKQEHEHEQLREDNTIVKLSIRFVPPPTLSQSISLSKGIIGKIRLRVVFLTFSLSLVLPLIQIRVFWWLYRGRLDNDPKPKYVKMSMKMDEQHHYTEIVQVSRLPAFPHPFPTSSCVTHFDDTPALPWIRALSASNAVRMSDFVILKEEAVSAVQTDETFCIYNHLAILDKAFFMEPRRAQDQSTWRPCHESKVLRAHG